MTSAGGACNKSLIDSKLAIQPWRDQPHLIQMITLLVHGRLTSKIDRQECIIIGSGLYDASLKQRANHGSMQTKSLHQMHAYIYQFEKAKAALPLIFGNL